VNDLNNMEPGVLFDKYGTHLIREVAMGGRIEVNTTYSSTTTGYTTEATAAVNAHIKYLKAALNLEAGAAYDNDCAKENIDEETEIKQFGGAFINTSSIEACSQNYGAWIQSFDQNLSNSALAGIVGENSLVGLWDLLDPADTARRQELENYFVESADESYDELCELFKLNNKRKVTVSIPDVDGAVPGKVEGNTSPYQRGEQVTLTAVPSAGFDFDGWYLGEEKLTADRVYTFAIDVDISLTAKFVRGEGLNGSGTSQDPYIITSREDFADIAKNMSAYYKLANDIDFGLMSWTPISGVFTGYIDGNGHKLTNVKITRSASAVTSDVCLGLFEQIATTSDGGGYIYNLHIWNSSLNVSECHDGSGTIYAGLLCGINNGTIDNCTFLSDVVSVKRDKSNVGTIAGASLNRIVNCQLATISVSGNGNIGGVAGYLSPSAVVELCHVSSSGNGDSSIELIAVNSNRSAGGIAGLAEGCTIKNCTVDYTRFSLAGDMRLVPAMGVISGYQLGGYLTGNPNTIAAITKECTDSSYKTCFFGVSWGICGRGDYNPVIN
ncbi:MAG: hypothetical protein J6T24_10525, partial [Clostridia bacterium]|nr:hypothetical protein [Clostridia bacterium]